MYSKWEQLHPWAYFSSSKNGWLCKICEEYSKTGDEFWKSKAHAYDDHPGKMFRHHIHGEKPKKAIDRKYALHSMLIKGNIKAQITIGVKNSEIQKREHNRRVISKFIKAIYFMYRKKWTLKNNFQDLMEHIRNLDDEDLIKNFQTIDKNATYHSRFTADEFVKISCDYVEDIFLNVFT